MRTIVLIRHAKAVGKDQGIPDFERSLVPKGEQVSARIARRLHKKSIRPDLYITSPANRALETAHVTAVVLGYPIEDIRLESVLYESSFGDAFLDVCRAVDDSVLMPALFGHNPAFSEFANMLCNEYNDDMPKSGVVVIDFDIDSWSALEASAGTLRRTVYPKKK